MVIGQSHIDFHVPMMLFLLVLCWVEHLEVNAISSMLYV